MWQGSRQWPQMVNNTAQSFEKPQSGLWFYLYGKGKFLQNLKKKGTMVMSIVFSVPQRVERVGCASSTTKSNCEYFMHANCLFTIDYIYYQYKNLQMEKIFHIQSSY